MLFGKEKMRILKNAKVAVFGLGGVGGYVIEALARSGIGAFDLIDNDDFDTTNLNRQILATRESIGRDKVDVARERILMINPDAKITVRKCFFLPENSGDFDFSEYDYVIDAVDTVTAKVQIIMQAKAAGVPVISSMGTGNKIDPALLQVSDIYKTSVCPLARVMRHEMKKRGVKKLKVVYSTEPPLECKEKITGKNGKPVPGSTAFVPSAAGLLLAGEVVRDLISL